ncbi:MAG TPA: Trk system potassium transporter TrkA [Candidatus Omnitrophica bacterium]|nr:Trk system potassium transporter TrkA [Candidatus Omnitrophota bacterium]
MNIVILGAGKVGSYIAQVLVKKGHDITLIDKDRQKLEQLKDTMDVGTVLGEGTDWEVLRKAEVNQADLFLAVTDVDEVNLIASFMGKKMGVKKTLCRTKGFLYTHKEKEKYQELFQVDTIISTEVLGALEIAKRLGHPGILTLEDFARGKIQMRQYELAEEAREVLGRPIKDLTLPEDILIASVLRDGNFLIPKGDDTLKKGDVITIIGSPDSIPQFQKIIGKQKESLRTTVIIGGGLLGFTLAKILEARRIPVKIIEQRKDRCTWLAENLNQTSIINGDATDRSLLEEEHIGQADVFIATTGDEKTNLLSCHLAKSLGVKNTICVSHRPEYTSIIEKSGINFAISPRNVTANRIITLLHREKIISATVINDEQAEILELYATPSAPAVGEPLSELNLPPSILIGGIVHNQRPFIPKGRDIIHPGDIVLVLCDAKLVEKVRSLIHP